LPSQREPTLHKSLRDACLDAARAGAAYIRTRTPDVARIACEEKSRADFVSEVDTGAEHHIVAALLQRFPDSVILGEELSPDGGTGPGVTFIVDPLDGTTNFLHGYPQFAVSIAALIDGGVSAAAIVDVPRADEYSASRGAGAERNGEPIHVSRITSPGRALIGTGFPFKHADLVDRYLPQFARVMRQVAGVRRAGSAALDLADVAAGRFDAFWELMLAPWDFAAGLLLIREAGGRVTDLQGRDIEPAHGPVVASNGVMHDWLLEQLLSGSGEAEQRDSGEAEG
jgi:myo-inositol-1(or 4)-monophosphatase